MSSLRTIEVGYTLITGATSTLGAEIARRRAATDKLLLHGRDAEALDVLANELRKITDVQTWCYDFENCSELHDVFLSLVKRNNLSIMRVVHAAGQLKILPLRSFELNDTLAIFNINLFSIIEILRALSRKNHRENLRSVVLLSAYFSKFGDKGNAIYSSSKGALNSLVKGLAVEFPKTRFNSLILGAVRTRMTEHLFDSNADSSRFTRYILGTGQPSFVADAVDFLLKENLWMTGQEVYFDGGASIA